MIPAPYLYGGLLVVGFLAGGSSMHVWQKAQRVDTIEQARVDEGKLQKGANQAGARYADALFEQQRTAERNENNFKRVLNEKNRDLDSCRVDAELVGLLDDAGRVPAPAGDPAEPGPAAARAAPAPDSTCAVELSICRANYAETCVPNAIHLREVLDFTRGMIRDYNKAIGR